MDLREIAYREIETGKIEKKIVHVRSGRRHAIRINNIEAKRNEYERSTTMTSRELIRVPVDSIALFCSEFIPDHFQNRKYITYILTVNGIDYEIEPINSHRNGKKIIRHSELDAGQSYAVYIKESIKSAFLTVIIESDGSSESPFLSNIKILYGRKVDSDGNI